MRITTIQELYEATIGGGFSIFVASHEFKCIETLESEYSGVLSRSWNERFGSSHDYVGFSYASKSGAMRQRSTLDMNIPENGYNDWRVFTTKKEAEEYIQSGAIQ